MPNMDDDGPEDEKAMRLHREARELVEKFGTGFECEVVEALNHRGHATAYLTALVCTMMPDGERAALLLRLRRRL